MIVKCNLHQSAPRLAEYLITQAGNERVELVANHGGMFTGLNADDYRMSAKEMQMRFDATSATYPCYHVQLSPGKDEALTPNQVQRTIDIYLEERRLTGRPHLATVHYKADSMHIHLQISRIDPLTGRADKNKMWRDDNDRARQKMEVEFDHRRTPQENPRRKDIKRQMTGLYSTAARPQDVIDGANKLGYMIAYGGSRSHPWQLVDSMAVGHNLTSLITVPVDGKEKKLTNKQLIDYFRGVRFPNLTDAIGLQRTTMNDRVAADKAAAEEMERAKKFKIKEQLNYSPDERPKKPKYRKGPDGWTEVGKSAAEKKPDIDLIEPPKKVVEEVPAKPRYRIKADAVPNKEKPEVVETDAAKKPVIEITMSEKQDAWDQAIKKAKQERFTRTAEVFAEQASDALGGTASQVKPVMTAQNVALNANKDRFDPEAEPEKAEIAEAERLKVERERLLKETTETLDQIFSRKKGRGLSL